VPEGDSIHNAAARLRPALEGKALVRFEAHRLAVPPPKPGTGITAVEAVGKHLLVRFADGHLLRTHLRMTGRWDLYRPGERWRKPAHLARALIEVEGAVAVCFSAPVVELTRERTDRAPSAVAHLGPDLCLADADLDRAVANMDLVEPGTGIAEVLLDQRVAAGIGNVYKSEVLWACRVHPLTPIGALDADTRRRLVTRAHELLRRNLRPGPRTTYGDRPGGRAVYGRTRRPCPRCGTPVQSRRTGEQARNTFWCPRCQARPAGGTGDRTHGGGTTASG
jgi:endonuclease-8